MNSPKLAVERLYEIVKDCHRHSELSERAALYSTARFLLDDIRKHFTPEEGRIDSHMSEKIHNVQWHIAAALGFDIDNGHDDGQHRVWALGQLNTLSDLIAERTTDEDG